MNPIIAPIPSTHSNPPMKTLLLLSLLSLGGTVFAEPLPFPVIIAPRPAVPAVQPALPSGPSLIPTSLSY